MAGRATFGGSQFHLIYQFRAITFGRPFLRGFPIQVKHLRLRPHVFVRVAVTIQTERHAEGFRVPHFIHLINRPVAFHAGNPAVHMDGVVEINIIRRLMNLNPRHRLIVFETLADRLQSRIIGQHGGVAFHAGLRGRNIGVPGFINIVVAVTTINPHLIGMHIVRKGNRLDRLIPHTRVFWGKIIGDTRNDTGTRHQSTHH